MIVESDIVAVGSVCGVMCGKHYNRTLRSHKTVSEALQRVHFKAFLSTMTEAEQIQTCNVIKDMTEKYPEDAFLAAVKSDEFNQICERYAEYVNQGNSACKTFALWSSYIEMVQQLLLFVRATRTTDWDLHLSAVRSMLPWFFARDRVNYARYLPLYWLEMLCVQDTHPGNAILNQIVTC